MFKKFFSKRYAAVFNLEPSKGDKERFEEIGNLTTEKGLKEELLHLTKDGKNYKSLMQYFCGVENTSEAKRRGVKEILNKFIKEDVGRFLKQKLQINGDQNRKRYLEEKIKEAQKSIKEIDKIFKLDGVEINFLIQQNNFRIELIVPSHSICEVSREYNEKKGRYEKKSFIGKKKKNWFLIHILIPKLIKSKSFKSQRTQNTRLYF